jgi:hypothetical protein
MISWPDQLVNDFARRRAILLIGSGISRHSVGDGGAVPPTWSMLLKGALALCNPKPAHIKLALQRGQYIDACDWLKKRLDERWIDYLRSSFLTPRFKPAPVHKSIYEIDTRIVLTPNFDKIYDTYAHTESQGTTIVKKPTDADVVDSIRRGDRVVLKAHGSIDDPETMIFTRSQYAGARIKYSSFYKLLDSLIMTNPVLMIGVGLDDPDFQLLFEDYAARYAGSTPHYMTFAGTPSDDLVRTVRETRNIKMLQYSARSNHLELAKALESLALLVAQKREALTRNMDW